MAAEPEQQSFHEDQGDGYDDSNPYLPRTPEAYRAAWADLERLWAETLTKAQTLDEDGARVRRRGVVLRQLHNFAERDLDVLIAGR